MVAPCASDLATTVDEAPPTQFRPSFGLGISADAAIIKQAFTSVSSTGLLSLATSRECHEPYYCHTCAHQYPMLQILDTAQSTMLVVE